MKTNKAILTVIFGLVLGYSSIAQYAEKTLVKAFNLGDKDQVFLDLQGQVELQEWENSILRIQMNISLEASTTMLKSLVRAGRYHLLSKSEDQDFVVFAPGMRKKLDVQEVITYTVFIPQHMTVKIRDELTSDPGKSAQDPSSL